MTTLHYLDRAYERANLGIDNASNFAKNAFFRGKRAAQMPKHEREYMESKDLTGISTRYYKDYIFIFAGSTCITVYCAPEWFMKKRNDKIYHCNNPKYRIRNRYDGYAFAN